MNNVDTKSPGGSLTSNDFNASQDELENIVTSANITLDPADTGVGGDHEMLKKAVAAYAGAGWAYTDSGTANAHVISIATNIEPVTEYFDNLVVAYIPGNANTSTTVTVNVETLGAKNIRLVGGALPGIGTINSSNILMLKYNVGAGYFEIIGGILSHDHSNLANGGRAVGQLIQTQITTDGAVATGTTVIPEDDTIPQITEGDEYITVSITPTKTTNRLIIDCIWNGSTGATSSNIIMALFQDAIANALATVWSAKDAITNSRSQAVLHFEMIAGTTSTITFRIRVGAPTAGTTTFNGVSATRNFGSNMESFLKVKEEEV